MPVIRKEGKDTIIFASKEDHSVPSNIDLPDLEPSPGLVLSNGEINWNCPCLGGMATGPCGLEFRDAFSCFHYSSAEPKGSDCFDLFKKMQMCMSTFPAVYKSKGSIDDFEDDEEEDKEEDVMEKQKSFADKSEDTRPAITTTTTMQDDIKNSETVNISNTTKQTIERAPTN